MEQKEIKKITECGIVVKITERKYDNGLVNYQVEGERIVRPAEGDKNEVKANQYGYADSLKSAETKAYQIIDTMRRDIEGAGMVWDERLKRAVKKD